MNRPAHTKSPRLGMPVFIATLKVALKLAAPFWRLSAVFACDGVNQASLTTEMFVFRKHGLPREVTEVTSASSDQCLKWEPSVEAQADQTRGVIVPPICKKLDQDDE